jgi:DNA-binding NtrC family response regulator
MGANRVLVVDDEQMVLDVFTRMLATSGYEVLAVGDPHQALEVVRNDPTIDAVLSDVTMPDMRGTELVREIASASPTTACVLVSGYLLDEAELPSGLPLLRKPPSVADLIAAVEGAIARSVELRAKLRQSIERGRELQQESNRLRSECEAIRQKSAEDIRQSRSNRERRNRKQEL